MNDCKLEDCAKPVGARGYCPMHYQRLRLHGSTSYTRPGETRAEMADRFWGRVEKTDRCWIWVARLKPAGYGEFSWKGREHNAHRIAYELAKGPIPSGKFIDHICHTPACVNPAHLRLATPKQNSENRAAANRTSKTGIRGVSLHAPSGKWRGSVTHHYVRHSKYFDTQREAAEYVAAKRAELFTHSSERIPA